MPKNQRAILGQNFLINKGIVSKIINSEKIDNETIIEIGPGKGSLTEELIKKAKKVIAIEKDPALCLFLKEKFKDKNNLEIIEGDILKTEIKEKEYKIIANIPYYITSFFLRKTLESKNPPKAMVLMIQKEVAKKICSEPPKMNLLSVSVKFYSEPKILFYVSKGSFSPRPKVDSAVIRIYPFPKRNIDSSIFFKIVKAGFKHPRKYLANNLKKELELREEKIETAFLKLGINKKERAEKLKVEDWIK